MFDRSPSTTHVLFLCDQNVAMMFEHVHLIVPKSSLNDLLDLAKECRAWLSSKYEICHNFFFKGLHINPPLFYAELTLQMSCVGQALKTLAGIFQKKKRRRRSYNKSRNKDEEEDGRRLKGLAMAPSGGQAFAGMCWED